MDMPGYFAATYRQRNTYLRGSPPPSFAQRLPYRLPTRQLAHRQRTRHKRSPLLMLTNEKSVPQRSKNFTAQNVRHSPYIVIDTGWPTHYKIFLVMNSPARARVDAAHSDLAFGVPLELRFASALIMGNIYRQFDPVSSP